MERVRSGVVGCLWDPEELLFAPSGHSSSDSSEAEENVLIAQFARDEEDLELFLTQNQIPSPLYSSLAKSTSKNGDVENASTLVIGANEEEYDDGDEEHQKSSSIITDTDSTLSAKKSKKKNPSATTTTTKKKSGSGGKSIYAKQYAAQQQQNQQGLQHQNDVDNDNNILPSSSQLASENGDDFLFAHSKVGGESDDDDDGTNSSSSSTAAALMLMKQTPLTSSASSSKLGNQQQPTIIQLKLGKKIVEKTGKHIDDMTAQSMFGKFSLDELNNEGGGNGKNRFGSNSPGEGAINDNNSTWDITNTYDDNNNGIIPFGLRKASSNNTLTTSGPSLVHQHHQMENEYYRQQAIQRKRQQLMDMEEGEDRGEELSSYPSSSQDFYDLPSKISNTSIKKKRVVKSAEDAAAMPRKAMQVPMDPSTGHPILPLTVGILTVHSLGSIPIDRAHLFHNKRYLWPVGYHTSRPYLSATLENASNPNVMTVYHSRILDATIFSPDEYVDNTGKKIPFVLANADSSPIPLGYAGPIFDVYGEDAPERHYQATTPTGAWTAIVKAINETKGRNYANSASGPDFYGLSNPTIGMLLEGTGGKGTDEEEWVRGVDGVEACLQYQRKIYKTSTTRKASVVSGNNTNPGQSSLTRTMKKIWIDLFIQSYAISSPLPVID